MQIRARYRWANTTLRDAAVYVPILDVDQWLEVGSAAPYDLYRITAVSAAGVGTFERVGGAGMTFGAVVAETVGGANVNGIGADAARSDHVHALPAFGTASGTFAQGNDSRLSDARTPTAHATSHKSGGSDPIKLDELAAPTDITTLDASTSAHGLLKKLPGGTTTFLRADGTFAAPSGSGSGTGSTALYVPPASAGTIDDEFDSTTLNGAWAFYDLTNSAARTPSGACDPYTALTGGTAVPRTTLHTDGRASWIRVQVTDTVATQTAFYRAITPPTNVFYWCRMKKSFNNVAPSGITAGNLMVFQMWASTSSHPDAANTVYVGLLVSGGAAAIGTDSLVANVSGGSGVTNTVTYYNYPDYFGLHKIGTKYYPYIWNEAGALICLKPGGFTNASTMAYIGWRMASNNTTAPMDIAAFDFIRESDVASVLPI